MSTQKNKKNIAAIYSLSPMQQGMLFHSLYEPESGVYCEQVTIDLTGEVNAAAFATAWQQVLDRHAVLRTFFVWENRNAPLQVVLKNVELPWQTLDWRSLDSDAQAQKLQQLLKSQRKAGFDLAQPPLMNCTLVQLDDEEYTFIWNHHHILIDGWCLPIIFQEVLSLYEAALQGVSCQLPTPRPYEDYITWLKEQDKEEAIAFWQKTLQGFTAPTSLVVDKAQPTTQRQAPETYAEIEAALSSTCSQKLSELAQQNHLTLATVVQSAWALLLSRYSNEKDIVFGVTVSGRPPALSGVEQMVGLFINTLPLRVAIPEDEKVLPWLQKVQKQSVELQQYAHTPLVDIQTQSDLSQGTSLFESIVVFENYPLDSEDLSRESCLRSSNLRGFEKTNYPLTIVAVPGSELTTRISYDSTRFEKATIERMMGHLQNILEAIANDPTQDVSNLSLLSAAERHQLLFEWNNTAIEYSQDSCIHELFEQQAEKTPDAIALVFDDAQLTYQELDRQANQLAHHLQTLGVKPETLVGLCLERSLDMIVGLLGILKAGGAYVPIDPKYPAERFNYILEDSGIEILVTQASLLDALSNGTASAVCIDRDKAAIASNASSKPDVTLNSNNLAYVIYTSGSTGKPKGVLVEHRNVVRLLKATESWYHFNSNDVWTNFHSIAFDFSVWEIWGALAYGGKLVVVPHCISQDTQRFYNLLSEQKVTVLNQTPSAFYQLINLEKIQENLPSLSLRFVIFGGEALDLSLLKPWFDCHGEQAPLLINMYGITETTVHVTYRPLIIEDTNSPSSVIGRPIPDLQLYLLDQNSQPVPIGVPGEMYVGGAGVTRGYLNRPELTQERFIPNPFEKGISNKLYKTGDLARYLPNGDIEYLGRIDHQVKIRGFRIELGEIEALLNSHPQINQAVVIAQGDNVSQKRLVAYVTSDSSLTPAQLRRYLKSQLPDYMVPSAFACIECFPLTPNGKVDRKALPVIETVARESNYVAPRTPSEEIIANLFSAVLNVENIGIHDSFFELGGHSLLATQLISRVRDAFSLEIPLKALFESPTVAELESAIAQFKQTKQTENSHLILPPVEPRAEASDLTLSFAQERLWFINQLEGNSANYNISGAFRITGNLNTHALTQALSEIVNRHEVLRTSFTAVNGQPLQVIHPPTPVKIDLLDCQELETAEQNSLVTAEAQKEAQTPFDLESAPLIRCRLLQLDRQDYVLFLTMHHIASDGWSMGVFVQEVSSLYQAFSQGKPSPLPALPIQYADFALWQRQHLSGERLATQLDYWKQQLAGAPDLLQLPTDRPRPNVQTYKGHTQSFILNKALTQKLNELAQTSGTTLFMTLYAAFSTLLYRYSGQSDIAVGSPIANRNRSELEGLIGFFVNTLVLRTRFEDNPNFKQLLSQVRETTLNAYENQDVPFERLVEALQPQRSLSHAPLAQVIFVLQNAPMGDVALPELTLSAIEQDTAMAKYDLWMSITETEDGMLSEWQYNTDLFNLSTIERMFTHFQNLLEAIVENPNQKVSELPLLSEPESDRILKAWNNTATEYPQDKCIHQLFEERAAKTPDAIALTFNQQQLTYQALNQKANQLAHYLKPLGIKPESLVGICVERSFDMVIGLLGVLKAGGAYVPLDPNYPPERLSHMLSDSGVGVLLTQASLRASLPEHPAKVVCLDEDWASIEQYPQENADTSATAENLAYVIYTSGSTGLPKGVAIEHRSVCNLSQAQANLFNIEAASNILQFSSFSFDASVWEIVMALTQGATLVLGTASELMPGNDLQQTLEKSAVTHVTLPPSALAVLPESALTQLNTIIVAGEACPLELAHQWSIGRRFFNAYGPTESTVCSTVKQIKPNSENITIGHPIANIKAYILDEYLQPVPVGVAGELYIGGDSLARGYLNRPELTQERFIPIPLHSPLYQDNRGGRDRLYKTGDLVRYLPDGDIEYLGRIDNQVKIRGFRIELGEIEAVLNAHPDIESGVVIAREDSNGNKGLVAYVGTTNASLTPRLLRDALESTLPDYMVPTVFVILEALPLTPNGKVDRKALPAPNADILRAGEYVAPRTVHEEIIGNIFTTLLELDNVAIDDDFFDLGGHSLLATQLVSRINKAFSIELSLQHIFETPTIGELAELVTQQQAPEEQKALGDRHPTPEISKRNKQDDIPLSWGQERLWFVNQLEKNSTTYNMPGVFRITGDLDVNALKRTLSEIVSRHEILRTRFATVNNQPIQVIQPDVSLDIPLTDLRGLETAKQEALVNEVVQKEANTPFDLERAPLLRCRLLQLEAQNYVLLLTLHHIVFDGWSMRVLIQEISSLYPAFAQGQPSPLPELSIQYADFALWQRQYLNNERLDTQLDYWKQQLSNAPERLELPTDRPRPDIQTYRGASHSVTLDASLAQKLNALSREAGTTLFMTLYAAFSTLLYRYSGQSDILVGSPVAGRDRTETESLIGFFLNTLVLRTRFEDNPSFKQLLANVKQTTLQAYQHQDLPFEKVVEALRPERSLSYSPLYQAWFVLQNISMPSLKLPDITITEVDSDLNISKCDLLLSITETEAGLESIWQYNTDLFEHSTIERLTSYFHHLLQEIVSNPDTKVRDLNLSEQSNESASARKSLGKLKQVQRVPRQLTQAN